jgi:hypothetical protein
MRTNRKIAVASAALTVALFFAGCKKGTALAPIENGTAGQDPSQSNLMQMPDGTVQAAPAQRVQVAGQSYSAQPTANGENYAQNGAQNESAQYNQAPATTGDYVYDESDDPYAEYADPNVYADQAPPPLPEYEQPEAPGPDYIWTPGYWDYANAGYYWVPGAWVAAPYAGGLWTPPWWGFYGGHYRFHRGYWATHIGFYGGINYGFGYIGYGYGGGYWRDNHFWYNRSYNRVRPDFRNVYTRNINVNQRYVNNSRNSYYGRGGINRPMAPQERIAAFQPHTNAMPSQIQHREAAQQDRRQFFTQNRGRPAQAVENRGLAAQAGIQRPAPLPRAVLQQRVNEVRQQQVQRQQLTQQRGPQNAQGVQQNRQPQEQVRGQQLQNRQQELNNRQQQVQTRQQQTVQRGQAEQQRQQQVQTQNGQRQQQLQQREQTNLQRQQTVQNTQNVQRQQQLQQRQQQLQQRQTQVQQNAVREQQNAQRVQQQNAQHQQVEAQRQQQVQQREQQNVQRQQQQVQRQQQQVQRQVQQAPRPAPMQRPAPAARPAASAPMARPEGGGEHHR